jgi:hypothetical protein
MTSNTMAHFQYTQQQVAIPIMILVILCIVTATATVSASSASASASASASVPAAAAAQPVRLRRRADNDSDNDDDDDDDDDDDVHRLQDQVLYEVHWSTERLFEQEFKEWLIPHMRDILSSTPGFISADVTTAVSSDTLANLKASHSQSACSPPGPLADPSEAFTDRRSDNDGDSDCSTPSDPCPGTTTTTSRSSCGHNSSTAVVQLTITFHIESLKKLEDYLSDGVALTQTQTQTQTQCYRKKDIVSQCMRVFGVKVHLMSHRIRKVDRRLFGRDTRIFTAQGVNRFPEQHLIQLHYISAQHRNIIPYR